MAGFIPYPGNVAYSTTKHAVVGLSQSLRAEAAMFGVRVSALCPGVVRTPILAGGKYGKIVVNISPEKLRERFEKLRPMEPDVLARKALNAIAKNKAIIIEPLQWKLIWWLNRLSPSLVMALTQKRFQRIQKELNLL
jgi:short-subunit dehydrogenase